MARSHAPGGPDPEGARGRSQRDRLLAGWHLHGKLRPRWHRAALARRESRRSRRSHKNKTEGPLKSKPLLLTLGGTGSLLFEARWSADGDVILAGSPWQT